MAVSKEDCRADEDGLDMTSAGFTEFLRRIAVVAAISAGLAGLGRWPLWISGVLVITGIVTYILLPAESRPQEALIFDRAPAVVMPDLVGLVIFSVLFAFPFWARLGEDYLWDDFGMLVHPASFLTWPLAVGGLVVLFFVGARNAAFWVLIRRDGLEVATASRRRLVPFDRIDRVTPYRRSLPGWVKALAPAAALAGNPTAAGAILVAGDETGMTLHLDGGHVVHITRAAFEKQFARIADALKENNVRFSGG